ncbi:MAG TPA: hypothetical protein VM012_01860 [Flavitalea sp.]|nr:hypothetical protein [Flavitalea sp.]
MAKVLFFARITFICNVCFVLALFLRYYPYLQGAFASTIIILGTVIAFIVNVLLHLVFLVLYLTGKHFRKHIPGWLLFANLMFLSIQLSFVIYDSQHYQR